MYNNTETCGQNPGLRSRAGTRETPFDGAPEANMLVPSKSGRISSRLAFVTGTKAYEDQMNLLQRGVEDGLVPTGSCDDLGLCDRGV